MNRLRGFPSFKTEASRAAYFAAYEEALAAWIEPHEEIDVPTRFGPTHVLACGLEDAPPLVLLPSFAATATVWRPNVGTLARHFRVYAVDVIGQPGKSTATQPLKSRADFSVWLVEVLNELGIDRASLVGCSFGGFLALSQASLTPDRVERVVLISPAGTFVAFPFTAMLAMLTGGLRRRAQAVLGKREPPSISSLRDMGAAPRPEDAAWRELMRVTMVESPRTNTIAVPVLHDDELQRIEAPTLLLIGSLERLYEPHAALKRAKCKMPALVGAIIPGADHLAALSQPEAVNARIVEWCSSG